MPLNRRHFVLTSWFAAALLGRTLAEEGPASTPRARDARLVVDQFAAAPDIVHPINMDFDSRGRLLVIESHTHFRPEGYQGPPHDRIRVLEDTDGDGKADRFSTFFEGTRFTMDIAAHPDGAVYLATRNEILRLRDTDGDGKADDSAAASSSSTPRATIRTTASPAWRSTPRATSTSAWARTSAPITRSSARDGTAIAGGGEGGSVFWCTADGKKAAARGDRVLEPVRRLPRRLRPPVRGGQRPRLHAAVPAGSRRRRRRLRLPVPLRPLGPASFQAWNGELPGTLPMVSGTGEAPCEVLSYESDGLPREYVGNLLVTSWADHRVERYVLKERGASFVSEAQPFVQGGKDFRPVGLAVAPDGSLFVSDWVLRDYNLHGKGAVWHVRRKGESEPPAAARPDARPDWPPRAVARGRRERARV